MFTKTALLSTLLFSFLLIVGSDSHAANFSRLKAAGKGLETNADNSDQKSDGDKGNFQGDGHKNNLKDPEIDTRYSGSDSSRKQNIAGMKDAILLGNFQIYLTTKHYNARLTVYAEPRKFALGHRACTRIERIRDGINTYLFNNPPETDRRGNVTSEGMDEGIREAIKKSLKTKLEYFTTIYVASGIWSDKNLPEEIKEVEVSDCAGIIRRYNEMQKEAGK